MKRILLVDDDPDILTSLQMLLEERYRVGVAANGREALDRLQENQFDALVLDLMMPVLDGVELVREMEARGIVIPVIIASAGSNLEYWRRKLRTADWIAKPFDIDALIQKIERATGGDSQPDAAPRASLA